MFVAETCKREQGREHAKTNFWIAFFRCGCALAYIVGVCQITFLRTGLAHASAVHRLNYDRSDYSLGADFWPIIPWALAVLEDGSRKDDRRRWSGKSSKFPTSCNKPNEPFMRRTITPSGNARSEVYVKITNCGNGFISESIASIVDINPKPYHPISSKVLTRLSSVA